MLNRHFKGQVCFNLFLFNEMNVQKMQKYVP